MALTADEERQIAMEMAVKSFFDRHFEEISFASRPSDRFHRFYILRAVLEDLSSAGYQINKIGDFSLDLGTSVAVKDARELSARAGRRLVEYIYGEIVAFEEGVIRGQGEKPAEKLFATVHVDGETVKKAIDERFKP